VAPAEAAPQLNWHTIRIKHSTKKPNPAVKRTARLRRLAAYLRR